MEFRRELGHIVYGPRLDTKVSLLRQVERAQDMVLDGLGVLTVDTINPWIDSERRKAGANSLEMKTMSRCLIWRFVSAAWRSKQVLHAAQVMSAAGLAWPPSLA